MIAPAATIVLTDDGGRVLFLKRHKKSAFMANVYVFPGGRLDDADAGVTDRVSASVVDAALPHMTGIDDPHAAAALVACAVRETFEEAGILVARARSGAPFALADAEREALRQAVHADARAFSALVRDADLVIGDGLRYIAHWVTPLGERRRFDTRFFAVAAPVGQLASHDAHETVADCWLTPAAALQRHRDGAFMLAPPTFCTLLALADTDRAAPRLAAERVEACPRIEPVIGNDAGRLVIALPGDALHAQAIADDTGATRVVWGEQGWELDAVR